MQNVIWMKFPKNLNNIVVLWLAVIFFHFLRNHYFPAKIYLGGAGGYYYVEYCLCRCTIW